MRAPAGGPVILVWAALSVFAAHTYPQASQEETLSGPDTVMRPARVRTAISSETGAENVRALRGMG